MYEWTPSKFGSYCMSLFICYKEVAERWINRTDVMIYSNPTISTKRMNDEKGKILFSPVSIYMKHFFSFHSFLYLCMLTMSVYIKSTCTFIDAVACFGWHSVWTYVYMLCQPHIYWWDIGERQLIGECLNFQKEA